MSKTTFEELFNKFLGERMSVEEIARFRELFNDDNNQVLRDQLLEGAYVNNAFVEESDYNLEDIFVKLLAQVEQHGEMPDISETPVITLPRRSRLFRFRYSAAVILITILGGAAYFFVAHKRVSSPSVATINPVLAPGGNKAILTLANGRIIILDSAQNGKISQQGNAQVVKVDSGLLAYNTNQGRKGGVVYNTITTPRGGQYQIILPDGTHAWLNCASSLTFPIVFIGKDRRVVLTGEGYFEVAKNPAHPFVVTSGQAHITVLGTHFDVMAYSDEKSINTTLLEGVVAVDAGGEQQLLKPGQQEVINKNDRSLSVQEVEVNRAVAWKNGIFDFKGVDVYTIMRQIARWYDVEVEYQGDLSDVELSGIISRRAYASELLKLLEATERVHFITQGNKIIVSPH